MSTTPETPQPPPRPNRRKRWLIVGLTLLALLVIACLATFFYLRSCRANTYIAGEIKRALTEYGIRAEIGGFELAWGLRTAKMRDVKLYNQENNQLIAVLDNLEVVTEIREPYAFRLRREVVFKEINLNG